MSAEPSFEYELAEGGVSDGYWIQAVDINGDGRPDLVTSGLAEGHVAWYENPGWRKRPIRSFKRPVALVQPDVAGDGRHDLVICHDYARTMFEATPEDGRVSWVRNPGTFDGDDEWEVRFIGQLGSTHRLAAADFTGSGRLEVLALPMVGGGSGQDAVHAPIKVMLYRRPDDVLEASEWESELVDGSNFRVIHAAALGDFGPPSPPGRQAAILASEEGLTWFGVDAQGDWRAEHLGIGETGQQPRTGFKGSGNVAVGRRGDDPYAYIAAIEPWHGNTLAMYVRTEGIGLAGARWRRSVLETFGEPNEANEGPAHHVVCADFDGDGDDELMVALRGPEPYQGVVHYKVTDLAGPRLERTRVSTPSAARIAVADFDGDGRLDFATIGYYVPGYFLCPEPQTAVFYNRFGKARSGQPAIPLEPLGG
jgi:hypothetical protein